MSVVVIIIAVIVVVIGAVLAYAATKPSVFRVERTVRAR